MTNVEITQKQANTTKSAVLGLRQPPEVVEAGPMQPAEVVAAGLMQPPEVLVQLPKGLRQPPEVVAAGLMQPPEVVVGLKFEVAVAVVGLKIEVAVAVVGLKIEVLLGLRHPPGWWRWGQGVRRWQPIGMECRRALLTQLRVLKEQGCKLPLTNNPVQS